ncbi:MAG: riboflavin kinase [Candidatus Peribacteraceae bacterium]|nr:riboflavin kinase [Candidatus Peribacteraceae bacterium]
MSPSAPLRFTARIVPGTGRGKQMGVPTFNLDLPSIPTDLPEGIYAAYASIDEQLLPAVVHYGPRSLHGESTSFEVHLFDPPPPASSLTVVIVKRLRSVQSFATEEALKAQIAMDIAQARAILAQS